MTFTGWIVGQGKVQYGIVKGVLVFFLPTYLILFLGNKLGSELITFSLYIYKTTYGFERREKRRKD